MIGKLASVGGFTLLSRVTGFLRDIIMSATLGAGVVNDAFVVAFKLPNHFRAIFGEGAFNAAFVPSYAQALEQEGRMRARLFSSRIYTLVIITQLVLLVAAEAFTPFFVDLLAPGFRADPDKFQLTVALTRITFPYLFFMTLVTLHSGALNAANKFAAAAFAPVLLNLTMIAALALVAFAPRTPFSAGYAAAIAVTVSGVLQLLLLEIAARRARVSSNLARPTLGAEEKHFFKTLLPAIIGSAGPQIAVFADTIIGSLLPTGGPSAIYYADRIYQLPIGVIGIAAGTVLLPEMARALAGGRIEEAYRAQNRTLGLTLALALPFAVAFLALPQLLIEAAFARGRFTLADAAAAGGVLQAYGGGLLAIVLIASMRAPFQARSDLRTPMIASLIAVAANVALKIVLFQPLGAVGLALATSVGVWINFLILYCLAVSRDLFAPDEALVKIFIAAFAAALPLGAFAAFGQAPARALFAEAGVLRAIGPLVALGAGGALIYGAAFVGVARIVKLDLSFAQRLTRRLRRP